METSCIGNILCYYTGYRNDAAFLNDALNVWMKLYQHSKHFSRLFYFPQRVVSCCSSWMFQQHEVVICQPPWYNHAPFTPVSLIKNTSYNKTSFILNSWVSRMFCFYCIQQVCLLNPGFENRCNYPIAILVAYSGFHGGGWGKFSLATGAYTIPGTTSLEDRDHSHLLISQLEQICKIRLDVDAGAQRQCYINDDDCRSGSLPEILQYRVWPGLEDGDLQHTSALAQSPKGDIELSHPSEINPNSDSRSRSEGRSRRYCNTG